jgi:hypothetical protein
VGNRKYRWSQNIGEVMVIEQPSRKGMIALERLGKGSPVFFV